MAELSTKPINEITRRLKDTLHPLKIYLFGSHATGQADEDSDIDLLAVVPDTEKSLREIAQQGRASLWGLKTPIDLIVCTNSQLERYGDVKNTVMNEALYEGRLVYGT
jgi:predicted nucleotidyltransferase